MDDPTEKIRRKLIKDGVPQRDLAAASERWDLDALRAEFDVIGFLAPFVAVVRKRDGVKGSLEFTHHPRLYFNFVED